jgi:hypothetical protein
LTGGNVEIDKIMKDMDQRQKDNEKNLMEKRDSFTLKTSEEQKQYKTTRENITIQAENKLKPEDVKWAKDNKDEYGKSQKTVSDNNDNKKKITDERGADLKNLNDITNKLAKDLKDTLDVSQAKYDKVANSGDIAASAKAKVELDKETATAKTAFNDKTKEATAVFDTKATALDDKETKVTTDFGKAEGVINQYKKYEKDLEAKEEESAEEMGLKGGTLTGEDGKPILDKDGKPIKLTALKAFEQKRKQLEQKFNEGVKKQNQFISEVAKTGSWIDNFLKTGVTESKNLELIANKMRAVPLGKKFNADEKDIGKGLQEFLKKTGIELPTEDSGTTKTEVKS